MVSKIALEEHFGATDPNIVEQSAEHFQADAWRAHRDLEHMQRVAKWKTR